MTWWRGLLLGWAVLTLIWIAGIAQLSVANWPTIPLDISVNDPALRAALDRATRTHVLRSAVIALAPPLLLLALGWLTARLRPAQP